MRTREERRQRAREVRWMIGVGAILCLTFWGGMAFAFWSWGDEMENIEHPDIAAAMRTGYPSWDNPYLMAKCDELLDYIEDEKWGDRIPGGWNG